MSVVIEVKNLYKYYGNIKAADGISFEVYEGTIFGMVGPNGAGKTTTIECIEGLRRPDSGIIRVLNLDPIKERLLLQKEIGIQLQESELYSHIKVKEALELFASFYHRPISWSDLVEKFGLKDKLNIYYKKLSGGLKKRLHLALALISNPKIVFLDEITTGLDPQARHNMWDIVKEIRSEGKTVFLTTHYMEEAHKLCDVLCIIDHGKIIALDKPNNLIKDLDAENKVLFTTQVCDLKFLEDLSCVSKVKRVDQQVIVYGKGREFLLTVVEALQKQGLHFQNLQLEEPSLEDVFLALTGRQYRD